MFSYISLIFSHLHQTCIGGPRQANSPSLQAALLAPRLAPSGSWRLSGPSPRALAPGSPFIPADSPSPKTRSGWHITAGSMSRARSRGPPCGHLACPHPDDSGGQWYCLPRDHGKCATPGASSVCKRPVCRRHFGMLGEKGDRCRCVRRSMALLKPLASGPGFCRVPDTSGVDVTFFL